MSKVEIGTNAPDFSLPVDSNSGEGLVLSDLDQPCVVYFYPKDDTPGCTKEAIAFSDYKNEFDVL